MVVLDSRRGFPIFKVSKNKEDSIDSQGGSAPSRRPRAEFLHLAGQTSSTLSSSHRIRMESSPRGSLRLFFSASLAFFFFLKLILSFSRLDPARCSCRAACCARALVDLGSPSETANRCLVLLLPPPLLPCSARCCLTLLATRNAMRARTSRMLMATATTAQSQAGVASVGRREDHFCSSKKKKEIYFFYLVFCAC